MRRLLRILLYLAAAAAAAVGAAVALVVFMPQDRVAALVSREVERTTGRQLVIEGDLSPSIWPVLGVSTGPIRLSNADWARAPDLISAAGIEIGVDLRTLISGDIRVERLRLLDPVIALEIAADGRNNWTFAGGAGAQAAPATPATPATPESGAPRAMRAIALPAAEIVNGRVSLTDARSGQSVEIEALDLTAELEALDQPVTLTASGLWQGRQARIEGRLATPQALIDGQEVTLDAKLEGDLGAASFSGAVAGLGDPLPRVDGFWALEVPEPGTLFAALGRAPDPALAPLGAVRLDGTAKTAESGLQATAKGRVVWRARPVLLELGFSSPDPAADAPKGDLTLTAQSEGLGQVSYAGPVTLGEGMPALDGTLKAEVSAPGAALAWATGADAPPALRDLGAVSANTALAVSEAGLKLGGRARATWRGRAVELDIDAKSGAGWARGGAVTLGLSAVSPGLLEARVDGRLTPGDAPGFSGPVRLATPDLRNLIAWATGKAPDAPAGTLGPARLAGTVELAGQRVDIRDLDAALDATEAKGSATVALGATPPTLTASLAAGDLDITPFMGGSGGVGGSGGSSGGGGRSGAAGGGGWSSEPFDLSGLGALNANVSIDARSIRAGDLRTGRSQLRANLQNGQLDLEVRRLDLYGGGVSGTVVFGGRDAARLATDLEIKAVDLHPLLSALGVTDRLEGHGTLRLQTQGQGRSMAELMRSLGGKGAIDLSDGAILGINLAAIAQNLSGRKTAERTDFSSVTGSFGIEKGVLSNSDFAFLGPLLRVTGAGTVDLGAQRQDLTLTPRAVATLVGQGGLITAAGLSIFPIRVTGSWSDPKVAPDLGAAIGQIVRSPVGVADGLQQVVTGVSVTKLPKEIIGTLTGREAQAAGAGAEPGSTPPEPAPRGLVGGLIGALDPTRRETPAEPAAAPSPAPSPAPSLSPPAEQAVEPPAEPAAGPLDGGASALAPATAPLPAPARRGADAAGRAPGLPTAPAEGSGEIREAPAATGTAARMPPPDEPSTATPAEQAPPPSIEEEAVRTLGNILRGFGKN